MGKWFDPRRLGRHSAISAIFTAAALATAFTGNLKAQPAIGISFNNTGLSSLQVNGTQFLAYGDFRLNGLTFLTPTGQSIPGDLTGALSVDSAQQTVTRVSSWGTIAIKYGVSGNRLNVAITVNNQSQNTIHDLWMEPFGIQFPSTPAEWMYPLVVNSIGQPAIQQTTYNSGVMVLAADDVLKPVQLGFPWSYNGPANTIFPLQLNTGTVSMYPNQYQAINRPIGPGASDRFSFSLRFGPPGASEETLAPDIYQAFSAAFPSTLNWPDRRPVGAIFLSTSATGWATNPRGWLLDPSINVFTPDGVANLKTRILALADNSISVLKGMNAQGMITWDIEGQQFPHSTSYVCDPTQFAATAPEMADIADAYFQKFTAAGLRVGVCVRPQQFVLSPDGKSAQQVFVTDPQQITDLMMAKVAYAVNRWGASLVYVDSNVNLTDPNPIPVSIFQKLTAAFPGVLFVPEHSDMQYFAYTAPYKQLNQGNTSTPPDVRTAYPSSFTVIYTADGPIAQDFNSLVTAVAAGDSLLFRGWYNDPQNAQDLSIYQQAGMVGPLHAPPTVSIASPGNGATVSNTITVAASALASGGASIANVQFTLDGNNIGTALSPPYSVQLNTTSLTNGVHNLTATAQDSLGGAGSATISFTVNNVTPPPTVTIVSPTNGATVSGTITITASASGAAGIANVQFQVDGSNLGGVSVAPYALQLNTANLTNGSHRLSAVATDGVGNSASAGITVIVSNISPPPTVTIVSPANRATVSGAITITASASSVAGITNVQFQVDGSNIGGVSAAPYAIQLNTVNLTNGSHSLTVVAADGLGNSATATITVTVNNLAPPPTVTIVSPANGATVSGTITLTASASGAAGIANVRFQVDGSPAGTVLAAPYSIQLSTANLTNGSHTLTAVAQDASGGVGSASATVTVNNAVAQPSNGFSYQRSIAIPHSKVANSDQMNFPVLFEGVYPYLANVANGGRVQNSSGYDIVFSSDVAGTNLLSWEVESYDPTTGAVVFWVKLPLLSHTSDTVVYMSYGNAGISTFQGNRTGTWDDNYSAVYHLSDSAGNFSVADATANGNGGTSQALTNSKTTGGAVGAGMQFDGASDSINGGWGNSLALTGPITFEAWVNVASLPSAGNQAYVLGKGYNGSNESYFLRFDTDNNWSTYIEAGTFTFPQSYQAQISVQGLSGGWHHLAGSYDGNWNVYLDGVKTTSNQTQAPFQSASEPFVIGAKDSTGSTKSFFHGVIDEVRVSKIARSSDWILTEFANQAQPSTFCVIGVEAPIGH